MYVVRFQHVIQGYSNLRFTTLCRIAHVRGFSTLWKILKFDIRYTTPKSCVISGFRREVDKICALLGHYAASRGTKVRKNPEESSPQRLSIFFSAKSRYLTDRTFRCYWLLWTLGCVSATHFFRVYGVRVVKLFMHTSHSHRRCGGIAPFILKLTTGLELTGQPHAVLCFGKEPRVSLGLESEWAAGRV